MSCPARPPRACGPWWPSGSVERSQRAVRYMWTTAMPGVLHAAMPVVKSTTMPGAASTAMPGVMAAPE